jgi:hypothetical protein
LAQSKVLELEENDTVSLVQSDKNSFLVNFLGQLLQPVYQSYLLLVYALERLSCANLVV